MILTLFNGFAGLDLIFDRFDFVLMVWVLSRCSTDCMATPLYKHMVHQAVQRADSHHMNIPMS